MSATGIIGKLRDDQPRAAGGAALQTGAARGQEKREKGPPLREREEGEGVEAGKEKERGGEGGVTKGKEGKG